MGSGNFHSSISEKGSVISSYSPFLNTVDGKTKSNNACLGSQPGFHAVTASPYFPIDVSFLASRTFTLFNVSNLSA